MIKKLSCLIVLIILVISVFLLYREIKNLENKIALVNTAQKNNQSIINKKIKKVEKENECAELIKKTPKRGNAKYIGISIVEYFKDIENQYEKVKNGEFKRKGDPQDNQAEFEFVEELYNEAKPLYEEYSKKCL